jgi:hypothetical protein
MIGMEEKRANAAFLRDSLRRASLFSERIADIEIEDPLGSVGQPSGQGVEGFSVTDEQGMAKLKDLLIFPRGRSWLRRPSAGKMLLDPSPFRGWAVGLVLHVHDNCVRKGCSVLPHAFAAESGAAKDGR